MIYVGVAGWTIPKPHVGEFRADGTHLERYARRLNAVEINSCFYRDHKPDTYAKWANAVPEGFRFSTKMLKKFTHEQRLQVDRSALKVSLAGPLQLREKLGCVLVQIPPSLAFEPAVARHFFSTLRSLYLGPVAFETRHNSWNADGAYGLENEFQISRVFADPKLCEHQALSSRAYSSIIYYRLHGTPEVYRSDYDSDRLREFLNQILAGASATENVWCIFDNTTFGHATKNALTINDWIKAQPASPESRPWAVDPR